MHGDAGEESAERSGTRGGCESNGGPWRWVATATDAARPGGKPRRAAGRMSQDCARGIGGSEKKRRDESLWEAQTLGGEWHRCRSGCDGSWSYILLKTFRFETDL